MRETIGGRIRQAREWAGLRQDEVAARMKCAQPNVCAWERGRRRPSLETLVRLAGALRCRLSDLDPRLGAP